MSAALPDHIPPRLYSRRVVGVVIALAALLIVIWLLGTPGGVLGKADAVGYAICHRIPSRSFHFHGRPLPLCVRCTGIYLGIMTGLIVFLLSRRGRTAKLPGIRVLAVLIVFGLSIAVDGLNSYLTLFPGYHPLYTPHNSLRLITGMAAGLTMITVVLPVFNATVWHTPRLAAPLAILKELAALVVIVGVEAVLALIDAPALRFIFALLSVTGVVLMFALIGAVLFLTVTRRENTVRSWRDLAVPGLAGLAFALAVIGAIDLARYVLTGTWEGFTSLG
jgi:uncharacterized membrane protein